MAEERLQGEGAGNLSARQIYFLTLMAHGDKRMAMDAYENKLADDVFNDRTPDCLKPGEA